MIDGSKEGVDEGKNSGAVRRGARIGRSGVAAGDGTRVCGHRARRACRCDDNLGRATTRGTVQDAGRAGAGDDSGASCLLPGAGRAPSDGGFAYRLRSLAAGRGLERALSGIGNGGFAGAIPYSGLAAALRSGQAAAGSDTGHSAGATDAKWADGHPEKIIDFGWRAVHRTAVAGQALVKAFYGTGPRNSYFISCSNGGRQALMEAQRFPGDYDGIIAGSPAYNWTGLFTDFIWNAQWLAKAGAAIPAAKTPALASAVLAQCDKLDGLADGLLSDPRQCHFDPAVLRCTAGDANSCLTDPQVATLRAIYQGPRTPDGKRIYFGFLPGGETAPGAPNWDLWIFGLAPGASAQNAFGGNFSKYHGRSSRRGGRRPISTSAAIIRGSRRKPPPPSMPPTPISPASRLEGAS